MRPPLSAIEPARRGVSMRDARRRASAASRVRSTAPAAGTAVRRRRGRRAAARCRLLPAPLGAAGCAAAAAACFCLLHLRHAEEDLPADQHERRQHDGEERVLLVVHLIARIARTALRRSRAVRPWMRHLEPRSAPSKSRSSARTAAPARRAVRSAHNHGRDAASSAAESLTISRSRRRTRLRSTALADLLRHGEADADRTTHRLACAPAARKPRSAPWLRWRRPGNRPVASAAPWERRRGAAGVRR